MAGLCVLGQRVVVSGSLCWNIHSGSSLDSDSRVDVLKVPPVGGVTPTKYHRQQPTRENWAGLAFIRSSEPSHVD